MIDRLPAEILVEIAHYVPSPLVLADSGWLHQDLFLGFPDPTAGLLDFVERYDIAKNENKNDFILDDGPLHDYFDGWGEGAFTGLKQFSCEIAALLCINKNVREKLRKSVAFLQLQKHLKYALLAESHACRWCRRKTDRTRINAERELSKRDYTVVGCEEHWWNIEGHFMTSEPNCTCWKCLAYKYPPDNVY